VILARYRREENCLLRFLSCRFDRAIRAAYEEYVNEVEMNQLLNLRPRDVEEAKVLVTS
jgi:hypothetical protein